MQTEFDTGAPTTDSAFAHLAEEYEFRKALAERSVREWVWSTSSWFDPRPLSFEIHAQVPGRRLRQPPADANGRVCCGLGEAGRVLVERQYNEFGFYETFYRWTARSIQAAHYDYCAPVKKPINLLEVELVEDRAVSSEVAAIHGFTRERYEWEGSRVTAVTVEHAKRRQGQLGPLAFLHVAKIDYDAQGAVSRVVLWWPPSPPERETELAELTFERRGKKIYRRRP